MRDRSTEGEAGTTDNYSRVRPPPPPNSVASRSRWTSSAVIAAPLSGQTEPLSELIPSEPIRQGEPAVPHSTQSSRAAFVLPQVPLARHADVPATDRKSTRLNSSTNAHLVCRLLLEKKKTNTPKSTTKHHQ